MVKQVVNEQDSCKLRQHAERLLAAKPQEFADAYSEHPNLLYELQIHQIELETQNQALLESRTIAESALERYDQLFNLAPIAFFSLSSDGKVERSNLSGCQLLGLDEYKLILKRAVAHLSRSWQAVRRLQLMSAQVLHERQTQYPAPALGCGQLLRS